MQGAHPFQAAAAPAHGFWPREVADRIFEHFGHDFRGRAARLFDGGEIDGPFGRVAFL